jgi:hypothetical protein
LTFWRHPWQSLAACGGGEHLHTMFSRFPVDLERAAALCESCSVFNQCFDAAENDENGEVPLMVGEVCGFRAGQTPEARIRRRGTVGTADGRRRAV